MDSVERLGPYNSLLQGLKMVLGGNVQPQVIQQLGGDESGTKVNEMN
jgi:hypothetical protein